MEISTGALYFLAIETGLFILLVFCIFVAKRRIRPTLSRVSRSLAESKDVCGEYRDFATQARQRYRNARKQLDEVDAHAIATGELSSYELLHIGRWRANLGGLSELMGSAPGIFITIGLLGTFLGLVFNLEQLARVLDSGPGEGGAPNDIIDQLSLILKPMSTAFISSLGGVFYSLLFWLVGLISGANRLLDETEQLLTAYLEQIVQADCQRFSLVSASIDRLDRSMSNFLARFTENVGKAIDSAMSKKVDEVFESIKSGSVALERYAETMSVGVRKLEESGDAFYRAAGLFSRSSFAEDFSIAVTQFLEEAEKLRNASRLLAADLEQASAKIPLLEAGWETVTDTIKFNARQSSDIVELIGESQNNFKDAISNVSESSKQLRAARLAINKENRETDELSRALLKELRDLQPAREYMSELMQRTYIQLEELASRSDSLARSIDDNRGVSSRLADLVESNLSLNQLDPSERQRLGALLAAITQSME